MEGQAPPRDAQVYQDPVLRRAARAVRDGLLVQDLLRRRLEGGDVTRVDDDC